MLQYAPMANVGKTTRSRVRIPCSKRILRQLLSIDGAFRAPGPHIVALDEGKAP